VSFNSFPFIFIFLPSVVIIQYWLIKKQISYKHIWIIIISFFFYCSFNFQSVYFLILSIIINFIIGNGILNSGDKKRRLLLITGLIINISLLGFFKYLNFFFESIKNLLNNGNIKSFELIIPIAISFITFQQISFLIDLYRKEIRELSFIKYLLYIIYFPKIISGPIVRYEELICQFNNFSLKKDNLIRATLIFSIGLFKKVIIADTLSKWTNIGFDQAQSLDFIEGWITSLSYTLQLYFDFSGYTDMAIAVSILFNIKLPFNFNSPYKSLNLREFWHRWHITLSRFLRDYIYIPLGGNRINEVRTNLNILVTMLLCGIWHGAGWGFIVWGALHGVGLIVYRIWSKTGVKINNYLAWMITFNYVNIAWVFFRAKDFGSAKKILKSMLDFRSIDFSIFKSVPIIFQDRWINFQWINPNTKYDSFTVIFVISALSLVIFTKNSNYLFLEKIKPKYAILAAVLFALSITLINEKSGFLYLRF
jgi:alginate O-acetyltransferase complex protein AlgI